VFIVEQRYIKYQTFTFTFYLLCCLQLLSQATNAALSLMTAKAHLLKVGILHVFFLLLTPVAFDESVAATQERPL